MEINFSHPILSTVVLQLYEDEPFRPILNTAVLQFHGNEPFRPTLSTAVLQATRLSFS